MNPRTCLWHWIGFVLFIAGSTACASPRNQPIVTPSSVVLAPDLLLNDESFPQNWHILPGDDEYDKGPSDATREFVPRENRPGHVIQDVLIFRSARAAAAEFRGYRETFFHKKPPPQTPSTDHRPPPQIQYQSPIADEYYFACGVDIVPICQVLYRYDNYFIYMFFDIESIEIDGKQYGGDDEGLQLEEIEPILRALDAQVADRLMISAHV